MIRTILTAAVFSVMSLGWMVSSAQAVGYLIPAIQKANADTDGDGRADAFVWFGEVESKDGKVLPVLMVISNQDFYYQEYADTRIEGRGDDAVLIATGPVYTGRLDVKDKEGKPVAAVCYGVSVLAWARVDGQGALQPVLTIANDQGDDSKIVFVGGWGSSMYQYDFPSYPNY